MTKDAPVLPAPVRTLIIAALIGLGVLIVAYVVAVAAVGDGVRVGTTVAGVPIGGLSVEQAKATLDEELGPKAAKPIRVRAESQVLSLDPAAAGLAFDAAATVEQASGRVLNPFALVAALTGDQQVEPVIRVDTDQLNEAIAQLAGEVDQPAQEPRLFIRGRQPVVQGGGPGSVVDQEALADQIRSALLMKRTPIDAVMTTAEPVVTPEAIEAGKTLARQAVSAPVVVQVNAVRAVIPPRAIAKALSFSVVDGEYVPKLDGAVLHDAIATDLAPVEDRGNDASFVIRQGKPVVVPSKVGRGVEDEELATQVGSVLANPAGDREVSVSIGTREPRITTEQAQALGITERISSFTQKFPYAPYRVQNIGQAAKYINGTLLLPGETFSMNDTARERTEANGYTEGFIISPGGIFSEELGGGVSAAATATWTAAFHAGLERVSTKAHSIYISRYQAGLEATVSWGNFDMQFRNDTPYGVLITASTTNTSMTVEMWSTRIYDKVIDESGPRTDVRSFSTIYDTSPKCLGQSGVDGFSINVDRVWYQGGKEVRRETIPTRYKPTPKVVCGEKKKKKDEFAAPNKKPGKATPSPTASVAPSPSGESGDAAAPAPGQ